MKLQHIRQSLDEIKLDDLRSLKELKDEIDELEISLNAKYRELDTIESKIEIINNILSIRNSKKRFMRFFRPILDFFLIIALTLTTISIASPSTLWVVFILTLVGISADAFYIIQREYGKVTDKDDSMLKRIVKAFLNIMMSIENINNTMSECLSVEEKVNAEIKQIEEDMNLKRNKRDRLNAEVSFVEGNIYAVDHMMDKYKMEDLNNETAVVQFIEDKRLSKGIIYPSY